MYVFKSFKRIIAFWLIVSFVSLTVAVPQVRAGEINLSLMPAPGTMVHLSAVFTPDHLQGITIRPDQPLKFDFLIQRGDRYLTDAQKKEEYSKLIKYFLTSLTVPDQDQWVNLSPYEHARIITDNFGKTEMGRDLLGQDYFLKQLTSSLMYPESGLGKKFWDRVYARAWEKFHTTNIPVNTFNKVWIVPDEAMVYESGNTAYIVKSHLKVMLEEDYLSLSKHTANMKVKSDTPHAVASQVIREIILPAIEKEVNYGQNFALLRQIVSGMILATWYKKALKESLLGKIYADQSKIKGVEQDPKANEVIYQKYLRAFKKGVYNYIKDDEDKYSHQMMPRKYFAGGFLKKIPLNVKTVQNDQETKVMIADAMDRAMEAGLDQTSVSLAGDIHVSDRSQAVVSLEKIRNLRLKASSALTTWRLNEPALRRIPEEEFGSVQKAIIAYLDGGSVEDLHSAVGIFVRNWVEGHPRKHGLLDTPLAANLIHWIGIVHLKDQLGSLSENMDALINYNGGPHGWDDLVGRFNKIWEDPDVQEFISTREPVKGHLGGVGHIVNGSLVNDLLELRLTGKLLISRQNNRLVDLIHQVREIRGGKSSNVHFELKPITKDSEEYTQRRMDPLRVIVVELAALANLQSLIRANDSAMLDHPAAEIGHFTRGGIDLNSANFDLQIKHDGKGRVLPIIQQDLAQLSRIDGFKARITEIKAVTNLPILNQLREELRANLN